MTVDINDIADKIRSEHGDDSIQLLDPDSPITPHPSISTGALNLDYALGIGGIPRGRITEVFGAESSGKSTLALHLIANAQEEGDVAVFVDTEHALDLVYADSIGVDVHDLMISQPNTGEQALDIVESLARSGDVGLIVVDSVAALVPRAELEGEMGDHQVALQARLMSKAMRKLSGALSRSDTAIVFTNQIRSKVGVYFGSPSTTPGGKALRFYSSLRVQLNRVATIEHQKKKIGIRIRAKTIKNKMSAPFQEAEFDIMFGEGISHESILLELATDFGIIEKAGSWYSLAETEETIAQGSENVKAALQEDEELAEKIENEVREEMGF